VLVVPAALAVRNFTEFMAYAKANPGKVSYSSTGVGTSSHLSGFMLFKAAGVDALHVPYKGADALNDLLAGRNQAMFATIPSVISHIKAGKLKAIAVSSPARSRSLPDVPTVAESGFPGFSAGSWFGLFVPRGTPRPVIDKINQGVNKALPGLQEQMIKEGADPIGGTPEQFGSFTQKEFEKWKVVVQQSGATQE
jgi:tripartite-type tricarboxylate transporter receptor subunit TctC